jgi:hypothetical protein
MTALVRTHESKAPENAEVVVINDRYRALCWLEDAYSMAAVVVGVSGQDFDQLMTEAARDTSPIYEKPR